MPRLSSLIRQDREYGEARTGLLTQIHAASPLPLLINGLSEGAGFAFLIETVRELAALSLTPALVLCDTPEDCRVAAQELEAGGVRTAVYSPRDLIFHNIAASHDRECERLSVLAALLHGQTDCVVTTPAAALGYTLPRARLSACSLLLTPGSQMEPEALCQTLSTLGFSRVELVEGPGQYARRGGIVDFFKGGVDQPVRVEFFGDEIDRMVYFDPITQRGGDACEEVKLLPAAEVMVGPEVRDRILREIDTLLPRAKDVGRERLLAERAVLEAGLTPDFRDKYLGLIYPERENLLSYFLASAASPASPTSSGASVSAAPRTDRNPAVFLLGTRALRESMRAALGALESERAAMLERGEVTERAAQYSADETRYNEFLAHAVPVHINTLSTGLGSMRAAGMFGFRSRRTVSYGTAPKMLAEDLADYRRNLWRTVVAVPNRAGVDSLRAALEAEDIQAVPVYDFLGFPAENMLPGQVFLTVADVREGYELQDPRIALLTMAVGEGQRLLEHRRRTRRLKRIGGAGERLMSYADLSVGDYVVHANYGIGRFEGIETVRVEGVERDYITVQYAGTDKLYVPCDQLEMLGKYIGTHNQDGTVKLSKMGGTDWSRLKSRAKGAAKDIARDLIRLYAERQRTPGFAFPPDSEMEEEFAASFGYPETDSQLTAIEQITADMCRPVPMNRLLCGDVGFGKTEVALRAAFKAILAGKQVAFLVPTTILALQHYETALSRMRGYPVTVEMISRFRPPKKQAQILADTERGRVDLLIGTHKLLSGKVRFRDLGLLIVDEEQRFGVSQKEKLKELAVGVDVLTLTATPIPRTLNMAMNGICDMSVLEEAPGDRRPVQTYVLEHDDVLLAEAMRRELARGGQVLYLYNRIEDIDLVAGRIQKDLPAARVAYAHGQMDREDLEDIWGDLVRGEIDILVSTAIIETGIDLPNANTLIIENADRMGLSQLHQIRGRVGRSSRQAYAYFTYRRGKALSEVAEKRLRAIREYAEFGAGFKIALRDLEIRGAGNLLGAEQHGYMESVGYDLYVKLLNEAVLEERGETPEAPFEARVDIRVSANIPEYYVASSAQRMEMYKKISLISDRAEMEDIIDEFLDRFGDLPRATENLCSVALLRAYAVRGRIRRVCEENGTLSFSLTQPDLACWSEVFGKYPGMRFRGGGDALTVLYRLPADAGAVKVALAVLEEYLRARATLGKTAEERSVPDEENH